jgi:hypothetical protein
MLVEIQSDAFISNGQVRPPIVFTEGLNSVLGDEGANNSIGKTSLLFVVDFVFGGDDYARSDDIITNVGFHTVNFKFRFSEKEYHFSRNTKDSQVVRICDEHYVPIPSVEPLPITGFNDFLKEKYKVSLDITWRNTISGFVRLHGRDNLEAKYPLKTYSTQSQREQVLRLFELFDYCGILDLASEAATTEDKVDTIQSAQRYGMMSAATNTKQVTGNDVKIQSLKSNLDEITSEQADPTILLEMDHNVTDRGMTLKKEIAIARRERTKLQSHYLRVSQGIDGDSFQISSDYSELKKFFPDVDVKSIQEIETFHQSLVVVLDAELEEAKADFEMKIEQVEQKIDSLLIELGTLGSAYSLPRPVLEKYAQISREIDYLTKQNELFDQTTILVEERRIASNRFKEVFDEARPEVQGRLNQKMEALNEIVGGKTTQAPVFVISNSGKSYKFKTPDDTGAGTGYKGMVVFDLSMLQLTQLPILLHDSNVLKQISDVRIEKILEQYQEAGKQVFIALDKQGSFSERAQQILNDTVVLRLSMDGNQLYGRPWNIKQANSEGEVKLLPEKQD